MKKLVLAAFAVVVVPTLVLAQGQVNFGTTDPSTQYIQYQNLTRAPGGTQATLWWSPDNSVAYVSIGTNSVTVNGWLTTSIVATTGVATPAGSSAWFQVRATDGTLSGATPNFQNATGNPNATPPTPAAGLDGWNAPITLVPEPSTFALAGLGVAALFLFRRRN